MATLVSSKPDRSVWLVVDAVSVNPAALNVNLIPCDGFERAYVEIDFDKAFTFYAEGHSGYGASTYYYQVNDSGTLLSNSVAAVGGSPYGFTIPCRNLAKVGVYVRNNGASAGTLTVRMVLAHD